MLRSPARIPHNTWLPPLSVPEMIFLRVLFPVVNHQLTWPQCKHAWVRGRGGRTFCYNFSPPPLLKRCILYKIYKYIWNINYTWWCEMTGMWWSLTTAKECYTRATLKCGSMTCFCGQPINDQSLKPMCPVSFLCADASVSDFFPYISVHHFLN